MVQAAEKGNGFNGSVFRWLAPPAQRRIAAQSLMRSVGVVVLEILGQDAAQMALTENDHVIEALATYRADQPLHVGILPRTAVRGLDIFDTERLDAPRKFFAVNSK